MIECTEEHPDKTAKFHIMTTDEVVVEQDIPIPIIRITMVCKNCGLFIRYAVSGF